MCISWSSYRVDTRDTYRTSGGSEEPRRPSPVASRLGLTRLYSRTNWIFTIVPPLLRHPRATIRPDRDTTKPLSSLLLDTDQQSFDSRIAFVTEACCLGSWNLLRRLHAIRNQEKKNSKPHKVLQSSKSRMTVTASHVMSCHVGLTLDDRTIGHKVPSTY